MCFKWLMEKKKCKTKNTILNLLSNKFRKNEFVWEFMGGILKCLLTTLAVRKLQGFGDSVVG